MKRFILMALALLFVAEPALAAVVRRMPRRYHRAYAERTASQWGFVLRGGFSTYAMDDVNDFLAASNVIAGTSFEEVDGGGSIGGGIRIWPGSDVMIEIAYERLLAESEEAFGPGEVNLDGNLGMLSFAYAPRAYSGVSLGIGAGVGFVSCDGEVRGPGGRGDIEGNGPAFHVFGLFDAPLGPSAAITMDAGYRYAIADDVDILGVASNVDVDWSGLVLRGGLAVYFP